jgi:hypothetical protein
VCATIGSSPPCTGSDSIVVTDDPAVAEGVAVDWAVVVPEVGAAAEAGAAAVDVGVGVGVDAGAAGAVVAVPVAAGVGASSAKAGAVPRAGTEAKARTSAASNAVFIRKEFTFIFHETAAQQTGQLSGRK